MMMTALQGYELFFSLHPMHHRNNNAMDTITLNKLSPSKKTEEASQILLIH